MDKKYCDILGINIPEVECKELQTEKLDDCKGCESKLESGLKSSVSKGPKVKTVMKEKIAEQAEPICVGCGKKASEVNKFNHTTKTCNSCYQKAYRVEKGPRRRKIRKGGYTPPPPEIVLCCSECGVRCTEAETFDIKERLCGDCGPEIEEPVQAKRWEETGTKRPGDEFKVCLDFFGYPEIFEELMTLAKNEMRSPVAQILYLLKYGNFDALKH